MTDGSNWGGMLFYYHAAARASEIVSFIKKTQERGAMQHLHNYYENRCRPFATFLTYSYSNTSTCRLSSVNSLPR